MTFLYLILGLAGLWIASDIVIAGALKIAEHYRISRVVVGLTVLSIGTGVPELFINVTAALERLAGTETSDLILGQTIGTSFGNAALILGFTGLIGVVAMRKKRVRRDASMMALGAVLLLLLGLDGGLSRADGALMLLVYAAYFVTLLREERVTDIIGIKGKKATLFQSVMYVIGGVLLLGFSADITVRYALELSARYGLAQSFVGAVIIGLGSSLPELVTSAKAVRRGHSDLAVGNLIGSTTFDILATIGIAAVISGLMVSAEVLQYDMVMLVVLSFLVGLVLISQAKLRKRESFALIAAYFLYITGKFGLAGIAAFFSA